MGSSNLELLHQSMRILKFFFTSFLQLGVIGLIFFFSLREILLVYSASALKSDYELLLAKNYGQMCGQQFGYTQDYWTQLRFLTAKQYQLELVCADFESQPIVLDSKSLPILVAKDSLGSGFVVDDKKLPYTIRLTVLGRSIHVFSESHKMYSQYLFPRDLDYALGPVTACQAHGYQCCILDIQSGQGNQVTEAEDCPKSCFESCLLRPMVLSFNSRPAVDFESRLVEVNVGQSVTFSYVIGNGKGDVFAQQLDKTSSSLWDRIQVLLSKNVQTSGLSLPVQITLDFGDGEHVLSQNLQDTFEHVYTCSSRTCFFNVTLTATDALGVSNLDSELSKIIIKANR